MEPNGNVFFFCGGHGSTSSICRLQNPNPSSRPSALEFFCSCYGRGPRSPHAFPLSQLFTALRRPPNASDTPRRDNQVPPPPSPIVGYQRFNHRSTAAVELNERYVHRDIDLRNCVRGEEGREPSQPKVDRPTAHERQIEGVGRKVCFVRMRGPPSIVRQCPTRGQPRSQTGRHSTEVIPRPA
jgi:hypothetical protein